MAQKAQLPTTPFGGRMAGSVVGVFSPVISNRYATSKDLCLQGFMSRIYVLQLDLAL